MSRRIVMVALAALVLVGCGSNSEPDGLATPPSAEQQREEDLLAERTLLERASYECSGTYTFDDGHGLEGTYGGEEFNALPVETFDCLIGELSIPTAITSRIENTRALDGMQTAQWDGLTATWTYHPDNGLWLLIEDDEGEQ